MSNEQSIDDILKLLKDSVSEDSTVGTEESNADEGLTDDMTEEALKSRLKMQYIDSEESISEEDSDGFDFFDDSKADNSAHSDYSIDNDFLQEVESAQPDESEDVFEEEIEELEEVDADEVFEETEKLEEIEELKEIENNDDFVQEEAEYDESEFFDIPDELKIYSSSDDEIYLENDEVSVDEYDEHQDGEIDEDLTFDELDTGDSDDTQITLSPEDFDEYENLEEPIAFEFYDKTDDTNEAEESLDDDAEDIVIDSAETGKSLEFDVYAPIDAEKEEPKSFEKLPQNASSELYRLFHEENTRNNFKAEETEDENTDDFFLFDSEEKEDVDSDGEMILPKDEDIDVSEMNIMMQLGFKDELSRAVGKEKVDDFVRYDKAQKETIRVEAEKRKISPRSTVIDDYVSTEQNDSIKEKYKSESIKSLVKLIGISLVSVLIWIIELIPALNIKVEGLFDYNTHPILYIMLGMQLLVLAAAVVYKPMLSGLTYSFSMAPTRHSPIAVTFVLSIVYDIVMMVLVGVTKCEFPPMFNALTSTLIALSAGADYIILLCEKKAFNVYSVNEKKYTLVQEADDGRIMEKLIKGGVSKNKNIYSSETVEFPRGFRQLFKTDGGNWRLIKVFTIPIFIFSVLASVISISLGRGISEMAATVMVAFCMSMPIMIIVSETLPCVIAAIRLEKRGSAVAGIDMYRKYAECDMLVFQDMHAFEPCKSEDLGIAIYDTSVGYLALGCFKALCNKIGGPLSSIEIELPDVFNFDDVKIRHISRNGIDAVVDGKHSFLVGDYSFMQRYGLVFPKSESDNKIKSTGILCLSLNQKVTAKISVKYDMVQLFEMLAQRLYEDGITPVITTYDPLISSGFISNGRTLGNSPVGVVHKNSYDFYEKNNKVTKRYSPDGIISCMSSFKLAEALVWCKRVEKIRRLCEITVAIFSIAGILFSVFFIALGIMQYIGQILITLYLLLELGIIGAITFANIPDKKYFTVNAVEEDLLADAEEEERAREKGDKSFMEKLKGIFGFDGENEEETDNVEDEHYESEPKKKKKNFPLSFKKKNDSKNSEKEQDEQ